MADGRNRGIDALGATRLSDFARVGAHRLLPLRNRPPPRLAVDQYTVGIRSGSHICLVGPRKYASVTVSVSPANLRCSRRTANDGLGFRPNPACLKPPSKLKKFRFFDNRFGKHENPGIIADMMDFEFDSADLANARAPLRCGPTGSKSGGGGDGSWRAQKRFPGVGSR